MTHAIVMPMTGLFRDATISGIHSEFYRNLTVALRYRPYSFALVYAGNQIFANKNFANNWRKDSGCTGESSVEFRQLANFN